MAQSNNRACML